MSTTTHNSERMVVGEADLRRQADEATPPPPAPAPAPRRSRRQSTPEPPPVTRAAADETQEDES